MIHDPRVYGLVKNQDDTELLWNFTRHSWILYPLILKISADYMNFCFSTFLVIKWLYEHQSILYCFESYIDRNRKWYWKHLLEEEQLLILRLNRVHSEESRGIKTWLEHSPVPIIMYTYDMRELSQYCNFIEFYFQFK